MQVRQVQQVRRGRTVRLLGALGVLSALLLAACGSSSGSDGSGTKGTSADKTTTTAAKGGLDLDGKVFTATGVEGYTPVPDSQLTLTFTGDHLSANAGCNNMSSSYEVTDGTLKWTGTPMGTQMACSDALMAQDTWLTNFLTKGAAAKLDGDVLTLTQGDVTITLEAVSDAELEGTKWTLESTVSKDAMSSLPAGIKAPTLTIAKDGTAQVFTGCNTGSTTVEVTDTTLTFAPMAMTRMMCEDAAAVETQVTTVLDGKTTYEIDGSTLTITNGDQGLVYHAPS